MRHQPALTFLPQEKVVICQKCWQPRTVSSCDGASRTVCPSCEEPLKESLDRPYSLQPWAEWLIVGVLALSALLMVVVLPTDNLYRTVHLSMGMATAVIALVARILVKTKTESAETACWTATGLLQVLGVVIVVKGFTF